LDDLMLDYFLSWLDIHIGEFVLGEDRPNGDWSENGFLNFVYNVKVNEVVMIIGAIFMYEKVLEMIGDERLGYFFMDLYNDKLGETLGGETVKSGDDYVVSGKFAEVIERVMNIVINDIYYSIIGRDGHDMMKLVEDTFYSLKLGDILYDTLEMTVGETLDLQMTENAKENVEANGGNYSLKGNYKVMLDTIFNIGIQDIVDLANGGDVAEFVENRFYPLTVRDIAFDGLRLALGGNEEIVFDGYAFENKEVTGRAHKIINATLGVSIKDVMDAVNDGKIIDLVKDVYGEVEVGDFAEIFMNVEEDEKGDWYDTDKNKLLVRILNDVFKVNVAQVIGYVQNEDGKDVNGIISEVVHDVFGDNTVGYYTSDFENSEAKLVLDRRLYKNSVGKVVISELVDKILEIENTDDILDLVEYIFGDVAIGDIVEMAMQNIDTNADGEWYNTDSEEKLLHIVNDLYSVTIKTVLKHVRNAGEKEIKEVVCDILDDVFGTHTIGYYTEDIKNENVKKYLEKDFFVNGTNDIVIAEYVRAILEAEEGKLVDVIRAPFNDVMLGNIVDLAKDVEKDGENWFDGEEKLPLIAAVFMNVSVENVFDYVEAFKGDTKDAVKTV
ncbi:MAG: hypothetical protein IJ706_05365, partial [Clostridia bacterium]|nr:hypothetical protein [Clostridia bacterium]